MNHSFRDPQPTVIELTMAEKNSTSQASEWRFSEIPTEDGLTSKGRLGFVISKKRETQRQGRTVTASLSLSPEEISNPSSAVLELEQRVSDDWGSRYRNGEIGRRGPTSLQLRQENVPSIQAARALRAMADGSYKPQNAASWVAAIESYPSATRSSEQTSAQQESG